MTPSQTPRQKALAWWQRHVEQGRYVVKASDGPDSSTTRYLLEKGHVVEVAGGRVWILAVPGREEAQDLCLRHYWSIVGVVIDDYSPAVIEGGSAVRVHLEDPTPPPVLTVRHAKNQSKYDVQVCQDQIVRLTPGPVDQGDLMLQTLGGVDLPTENPEPTLFRLPLSVLEDHLEETAIWLRSLVISPRELRSVYQKNPRPVVAKRMAHLAADVGNDRLARQIDDLLTAEYGQRISRERTGVGSRVVVPKHVTEVPRTRAPWLDRHVSTLARTHRVLTEALEGREDELPRFPLEQLKEQARAAKSYDAYHSTTIEGYRISPEEVSAVLRDEPVAGQDPEDVRSRMAIRNDDRPEYFRWLEKAQVEGDPLPFGGLVAGYVEAATRELA